MRILRKKIQRRVRFDHKGGRTCLPRAAGSPGKKERTEEEGQGSLAGGKAEGPEGLGVPVHPRFSGAIR